MITFLFWKDPYYITQQPQHHHHAFLTFFFILIIIFLRKHLISIFGPTLNTATYTCDICDIYPYHTSILHIWNLSIFIPFLIHCLLEYTYFPFGVRLCLASRLPLVSSFRYVSWHLNIPTPILWDTVSISIFSPILLLFFTQNISSFYFGMCALDPENRV